MLLRKDREDEDKVVEKIVVDKKKQESLTQSQMKQGESMNEGSAKHEQDEGDAGGEPSAPVGAEIDMQQQQQGTKLRKGSKQSRQSQHSERQSPSGSGSQGRSE